MNAMIAFSLCNGEGDQGIFPRSYNFKEERKEKYAEREGK